MLKTIGITMLAMASSLAAAEGEGRACSNATLKGVYGFLITGTRPTGPPTAPMEQMIGVAIRTFDGAGNFTNADSVHGSITGVSDRPGTGTYSLNEDCSGTLTIVNEGAPVLETRIVVVNKGKEILLTVMSPATIMVTAIGKKR